ncbi:unnamed protein product [Adineta steineri]|uniref:Uncharacterized protein n=1 Tax=Adineta steineri TaxID=433720 RepID=A0A815U9Q2_9BILA|nr:unnamed protein product [Adineta steineri]CAF4170141.1 unnamed protein product [Adineta steineri]
MISEEEYYTVLRKLHNIPANYTGKRRQNYRQKIKKQIKEYEYNIKYAPFTPLPHIPYLVNKITSEPILQQLIEAATPATRFTLDTESMKVYKEPNRPSLIQLQILLPYRLSLVIIFEMHHLPDRRSNNFTLMQQLFTTILIPEKFIYIWGKKDELIPFIEFELFIEEQINSINENNLQNKYKLLWNQLNPHRRHEHEQINLKENECLCELCIGKNASEPSSLQDSVAYSFQEYLPKIYTEGDFHMVLDTKLFDGNKETQEYRQQLRKYALYDCLSMQRIIILMEENDFTCEQIIEPSKESKIILSLSRNSNNEANDDNIYEQQRKKSSNQIYSTNKPTAPSIEILERNNILSVEDESIINNLEQEIPIIGSRRYPMDWESLQANQNPEQLHEQPHEQLHEQLPEQLHEQPHEQLHEQLPEQLHEQPHEQLHEQSPEDKQKRIHNRKCTVKQRRRYYRNKLIFYNVYHRFSVKQTKNILKQEHIPIYVVQPKKSSTNQHSLHVAVRNPEFIRSYERQTQGFFTKKHYDELKATGRLQQQ